MKMTTVQVRRKPRQSRAKMTQDALIESFVQLLAEQPADRITIREITEIAGVGLGTFYEYFAQKQDLIALTIHQYVKQSAIALHSYAQSYIELSTDVDIFTYLSSLIHFQIKHIQRQQPIWAQIFLLERQVSSPEAYRKHYQLMLELWNTLLMPFVNDLKARADFALNIQRISYGFISQSLLIQPDFKAWDSLEQDILKSLTSFIEAFSCSKAKQ